MNEVITEIMKEKRIKAKAPPIFIAGILNQLLENPENINPTTLNPGTTRVTRYRAIAEEIHLKRLKVTMFKGRSKIFRTGLTRYEEAVNPTPASRRVTTPCSNTRPLVKLKTR